MDDKIKTKLNDLFNYHCILLAEHGEFMPIYFLIKDGMITPMFVSPNSVHFEVYSAWVLDQASIINADGLVLISEQCVVLGNKNDTDIKAIIKGTIKASDHPNNAQYLILAYMNIDGSKESLFGKIENDPIGVKFIKKQEWALETIFPMPVLWR